MGRPDRVSGRAPRLGLTRLRRTAISIDPPDGTDTRSRPFTKTVVDDFYMLPEGGKLIGSRVDEIPAEQCDAQPEKMDAAMAAARVEEYTTLSIRRIGHGWAGLRTFAPDRTPLVGADPREPSFFWLAGQGGFGLHIAPAVAAAAAPLLLDGPSPRALAAEGVPAHELTPERLIHAN